MEWRVIASHPEYEVSSAGEVRRGGKVLKGNTMTIGYKGVTLVQGPQLLVHRLVALAFIPNPENTREVDHINRVKTDNRVENLRWASRNENMTNIGVRHDNKLGEKHIHFCPQRRSFVVQITRNKQSVYAKRFKDLDDAIVERDLFLLFQ